MCSMSSSVGPGADSPSVWHLFSNASYSPTPVRSKARRCLHELTPGKALFVKRRSFSLKMSRVMSLLVAHVCCYLWMTRDSRDVDLPFGTVRNVGTQKAQKNKKHKTQFQFCFCLLCSCAFCVLRSTGRSGRGIRWRR